ncbi:MAG TPA: universal stress protein [Devosia sp.]|nr:universal stress protein [Devosia sp.]
MEIRSVLVNVDVANPDAPALRYAIDLAGKFGSTLIGVAADQPDIAYAGVDGGAAIDLYSTELSEIETQLARAEDAFQSLVPQTMKRQWRAYVANRTVALVQNAVLADVIVTASNTTSTFHHQQAANLGTLVLSTGRPVIDVATSAKQARLDRICIGWKDTREARRAVKDALPLLKMAREIEAITIGEGDYARERASLDDLLSWLRGHDIGARGEIVNNPEGYLDALETHALQREADLLIIGGYGHSRMREWLFGGVTRSVLEDDSLNRLLSN